MEILALYEQAGDWTKSKLEGAKANLDAQTACTDWTVRDLVNHLLLGEQIFGALARGEQGGPPQGEPPDLLEDRDPAEAFDAARRAIAASFRSSEIDDEQKQMFAGIAFADTLMHGWDVAKGTGQDTTMPDDLAEAAFGILQGRLPEDRGSNFAPEVKVSADAPVQDKLLGYTGRTP